MIAAKFVVADKNGGIIMYEKLRDESYRGYTIQFYKLVGRDYVRVTIYRGVKIISTFGEKNKDIGLKKAIQIINRMGMR